MKVCIEPGCWQPTPDTRCPEHALAHRRRVKDPLYATPAHRAVQRDSKCACCGATTDLCRDHVRVWDPLTLAWCVDYQTLCRPCNGSKGGRVMEGTTCPMHGGVPR